MTYKGHAIHQPVHAVLGIPRHNILAIGITMAASEEMPDEGDFKLEVESVIAGAYKWVWQCMQKVATSCISTR